MTESLAYEALKDVFGISTILGTDWLMSLILTLITLVIICKTVDDWKELAFPVVVGWYVVGVQTQPWILTGFALQFAISSHLGTMMYRGIEKTIKRVTKIGQTQRKATKETQYRQRLGDEKIAQWMKWRKAKDNYENPRKEIDELGRQVRDATREGKKVSPSSKNTITSKDLE